MKITTDGSDILHGIKVVIFDCDGVIWNAYEPLKGSQETVHAMRASGRHVRFVTNNATNGQAEVEQQLKQRGFGPLREIDLLSASQATMLQLRSLGLHGFEGNILYMGSEGFIPDLEKGLAPGYIVYGPELFADVNNPQDSPGLPPMDPTKLIQSIDKPLLPAPRGKHENPSARCSLKELDIRAVVLGLLENAETPTQLVLASLALQRPDKQCLLVLTNGDDFYILEGAADRYRIPCTAAWASVLLSTIGRQPDFICGKPQPSLGALVLQSFPEPVEPHEVLMVGDSIHTDIAFGKACGFRTLLVLSGCTNYTKGISIQPDYVARDLNVLRYNH